MSWLSELFFPSPVSLPPVVAAPRTLADYDRDYRLKEQACQKANARVGEYERSHKNKIFVLNSRIYAPVNSWRNPERDQIYFAAATALRARNESLRARAEFLRQSGRIK